jgi:lambda family phage portal protein
MGLFDLFRSQAPASAPAARPRATGEFMRGERNSIFQSWLPILRDSREDVRSAYWLSAARTVDMVHNSGWLAGLVRQAKASILGDGLDLVAQPDYEALGWTHDEATEWARRVKNRWTAWASSPLECDAAGKWDLHQQAHSALGSYFGNGEIVQLMRWIDRPQSMSRTKVQLVPAHRLVQDSNGIDTYQGIKIDLNGLPVSYLLRLPTPLLETGTIVEMRARDAANRPNVVHIFDGEIGQMRGISPFAPALQVIRQYDQLSNATLSNSLMQAIFAATITSESPTSEVLNAFQDPEEQGVGGTIDSYMDQRADWYDATKIDLGGQSRLAHLFPGEKLDFKTGGGPFPNYLPFTENLLRELAVCAGHTVEEVTGNYSGASYTSVRIATTTRWPITMFRRRHIAAPFYQAAYECWLEEEIDSGLTPFPGGMPGFLAQRNAACRAKWRGPPKPQADDLKYAKASETLYHLNATSLEKICSENGDDWEDVLQQRAEEMKMRKKLGLPEPIISGSTILDEDELDDEIDDQSGKDDTADDAKPAPAKPAKSPEKSK